MSRPHVLPPGVLVPADVCAQLGPVLAGMLDAARRDRRIVDDDTLETIDRIDLVGAAWRNRVPQVPREVPPLDVRGSEAGRSTVMTVHAAAEILGISTRAVTKRLVAGTLAGRKTAGAWRVEVASVLKEPQ